MTRRLVIQVGGPELRIAIRRGTRLEAEAVMPCSVPEGVEDALRRLRERSEMRRLPRRALVRLERPLVQCRALTGLPAVAPRELPRLVAHNASRYFRQNGHALVTAGAWETRPGGTARLAAAEAEVVTALLRTTEAAGFVVEDIVTAEPGAPELSLLPMSERSRRTTRAWRRVGWAAALAAGTWALVLAWTIGRLALEDRRLSRQLAGLEEPRAALARANREAAAAASMLLTLQAAERDRGQLSGRLAQIGAALPTEGAALRISVDRGGQGEVTGLAPSAAAVLDRLGRRFPAHLAAPVSREAGPVGELDRYLIRLGAPETP